MFDNSLRVSLAVDEACFEIPDALKRVYFLYIIFFTGRLNNE